MSKIMTWCAGLALAGAVAGCGQPTAVGTAASWGRAVGVPGLGALNTGGLAWVNSVSCASAGDCAAGGFYLDRHGRWQGFVVAENNGRWGRAVGVPGLGALNAGGHAAVGVVSCASAGNCVAGGGYRDRLGHGQGFVVAEENGIWGRAVGVPGLGALNAGGHAAVGVVSCASAGNCVAGGGYTDRHDRPQGFVVAEANGIWGRAIEVPGLAALNAGREAQVSSVSCGSAGNCVAGGYYYADRSEQGFVAVETNGVWGRAVQVPGMSALNTGRGAAVRAVSCAAGYCAAGGFYTDGDGSAQGFVASEKNGVWHRAIEVPGLGALNTGDAEVDSLSCVSQGNCAAGGNYGEPYDSGFVAVETNGVWGTAIEVPGLAALQGRLGGDVFSVSCASAGNCAVSGDYTDGSGISQGFVVSERNGMWGRAIEMPRPGSLNQGDARVSEVSCAAAGTCAAGGYYTDRHHQAQGFVLSQMP